MSIKWISNPNIYLDEYLDFLTITTFMKKTTNWLSKIKFLLSDEKFLQGIHLTENVVSKVLSLALVVVIMVCLFDLIWVLLNDVFVKQPLFFLNKTIVEIFGLFLNILIALELLENVTGYLRKHIVQVELVIVTALIAIARKIIIFDPKQYDKIDLISLGFGCLALAVSYWLIRKTNQS